MTKKDINPQSHFNAQRSGDEPYKHLRSHVVKYGMTPNEHKEYKKDFKQPAPTLSEEAHMWGKPSNEEARKTIQERNAKLQHISNDTGYSFHSMKEHEHPNWGDGKGNPKGDVR